jgi:hypothetical protein
VNSEIVGTILTSLGGASLIISLFAHFLGKIWADRIAKQTVAKINQDLEVLKSKNTLALEEFKKRSESELKDREQFSGISLEVYQDFFKNRVEIYLKLLQIKNKYISDMHEDFVTVETEGWGEAYYLIYNQLRTLLIENQLYISNDLESSFHELRMKAATHVKEADMVEGYVMGACAEPWEVDEKTKPIYEKFANETYELMSKVMLQIGLDVTKLRSRIEIDRA